MRTASSLMTLVAGMLAGIIFVLACSDDSPSRADAATCDCPAAEPPLAGRIVDRSYEFELAANARGGNSYECPEGAVLLSGSCTTATLSPLRDVTLEQSGFYEVAGAWSCRFKNNEATPVMVKVTARCLMPAQ